MYIFRFSCDSGCDPGFLAATTFTSKPPNPSFVEESRDITLEWTYTLSQGISFSELINTTDGGSPVVIAQWSAGGTTLNPIFTGRFEADISNTKAWLKIIAMKRSDEGKYKFELQTSNFGGDLQDEVEVIVQCKYTIVASCKDH